MNGSGALGIVYYHARAATLWLSPPPAPPPPPPPCSLCVVPLLDPRRQPLRLTPPPPPFGAVLRESLAGRGSARGGQGEGAATRQEVRWSGRVEKWGRGLLIYLGGSLLSWLGRGKRRNFHYFELWEFCCIDDQQWTAIYLLKLAL